MINLPHFCCCTELKVNPQNWQTNKNAVKKNWFIYTGFMTLHLKLSQYTQKRIAKTKEFIEAELNRPKNYNVKNVKM